MKFLWTTINVKNIEKSIAFYTDVTKLKVLNRFSPEQNMEIVFLGNGKENETLVELIYNKNITDISFTDFVTLGFEVFSLDDTIEIINEKNIEIVGKIVETPSFKFFCIKDPNGVNIQFFQNK